MGVRVFVVVAGRHIAELPLEALAAGIVLSRRAVAVTTPVANRFDRTPKQVIVSEYGAALAHGDVVCRIEAQGTHVTKSADLFISVCCTKCITAILDHPQIVSSGDVHYG